MTKIDQSLPVIIQGGMGFSISTWLLARTVALLGGLGTVSGVALERSLAIGLQNGDIGGHIRMALSHFPFPHIARMVLDAFFKEEGDPGRLNKRGIPMFRIEPCPLLQATCICANFAYVWLAKHDDNGHSHGRPISINYLDKIAMPHIYAILGAMLAGVDYITMGAGIPFHIPELINAIIQGRKARYNIPIDGDYKDMHEIILHPEAFLGGRLPSMTNPRFLPIVSSHVLAAYLHKKLPGQIFGYIVEEDTAGGHNARPRGQYEITASGEPVYGPRDGADYEQMRALGLPFWIGGSKASPEKLAWALAEGASGIQVGSAFALCDESGMDPVWKKLARKQAFEGKLRVRTDILASPTDFPFKVAVIPGTLSEMAIYLARKRSCEQGVLRTPYRKADGNIGYRCPAEPIEHYVAKGGKPEDTVGRKCICTGLMALAGLSNPEEPPVMTLGNDAIRVTPLLMDHADDSYTAEDVFRYLGQKV